MTRVPLFARRLEEEQVTRYIFENMRVDDSSRKSSWIPTFGIIARRRNSAGFSKILLSSTCSART